MDFLELQKTLQILTNSDIKQVDIANALGTYRSTLSRKIKENRQVTNNEMIKISEFFGVNIDLLRNNTYANIGGIICNVEKITENDNELITIEHIHISPSCGTGTTVLTLPEVTPIKLGRKMIETVLKVSDPSKLKVFTACGDSMEDTIDDGNLLLVDTGRTDFNNGGIFIITINNEWFVKRLRKRINGQLDIISDNQAKYPIESYMPEDNIEIVVKGRVIKNLSKGL